MGVHDMRLSNSIVEGHNLSKITSHIDNIVNINFQCKARLTALHTTVTYSNVEVATLLLQRGADMMVAPLKTCVKNESECALLMVFKKGESHEDMQLLLLRHLFNTSRAKFDSVALKNIARVTQYAMLYSSTRVSFAAKQMMTKKVVVNSTGFNPFMFTIIQVGLFEENVAKCVKVLEQVLEIVDKDPTMSWQRYYSTKSTKKGVSESPYTGATALGMMVFRIVADRQKHCTEYAGYLGGILRGRTLMAQYMPPTNPHHNGFIQFGIERDAEQKLIHERNLVLMVYFTNEFAVCLFARMLSPTPPRAHWIDWTRDMRTTRVGKTVACTYPMLLSEP